MSLVSQRALSSAVTPSNCWIGVFVSTGQVDDSTCRRFTLPPAVRAYTLTESVFSWCRVPKPLGWPSSWQALHLTLSFSQLLKQHHAGEPSGAGTCQLTQPSLGNF